MDLRRPWSRARVAISGALRVRSIATRVTAVDWDVLSSCMGNYNDLTYVDPGVDPGVDPWSRARVAISGALRIRSIATRVTAVQTEWPLA